MSDSDDVTRRGLLVGAAATAGAAVAAEPAAAQEGDGGGSGTTRTVGMGSSAFEPSSITVAPGDTVEWENTSSLGHSVTAYEEDIPDGATYFASGGWDSEEAARDNYERENADSGYLAPDDTYSHTFETLGTYEYFCIPHEAAGMTGTVEVVEGGPAEGEGYTSPVTDAFKTLGVATVGTMVSVLVLAYAFLKYGGLDPAGRE